MSNRQSHLRWFFSLAAGSRLSLAPGPHSRRERADPRLDFHVLGFGTYAGAFLLPYLPYPPYPPHLP